MGRKLGYILGAAVIVMTLVVLLDHARQTAQMRALNQAIDDSGKARENLREELKRLATANEGLAASVAARAGDAAALEQALTRCREAVDANAAGAAALAREIATLREKLARGVTIGTAGQDGATTSPIPPAGAADEPPAGDGDVPPPPLASYEGNDGLPRLDRNFLLPPEDTFDPAKLGGTFRMYKETPKGLNSLVENAATNTDIDGLVNDSLCTRDRRDPSRWRSRLATSCVISDDYKVFTFTLRPGVSWHVPPLAAEPGREFLGRRVALTADDFVFYVRMLKDENVECPHLKVYYEKLERAEAPDPHTLRLVWSEKLYTNLSASLGLEPLPRHVYAVDATGKPYAPQELGRRFSDNHWFDAADQHIGVGPYRLVAYQPDLVMRFDRNPAYWGSTQHFETIQFNLQVKQDDQQLTGFKNGDVHTYGLSPQAYRAEILAGGEPRFAPPDPANPQAGRRGELGWEKVKVLAYSYIGWNMRRPLFADKRVRQAMSHAFPRERLIKEVYMGLGRPINTNVHPDSPYANLDLPAYAFSKAKAARLLAAAGWADADKDGWLDKVIEGERRTLRFEVKIYANSPEWDRTMAIFAEELKTIGVDMTVRPLEWKDLLQTYQDRDFDAISGGWRMAYEVDFKQLWHSEEAAKPGSSNHCGFDDPRADALIERMRTTFDLAERIAIAREFQAIIHEEQPYTFFRSSEGIFVWQNQAQGGDRQALGGVVEALDALHPFYNRYNKWWYFRR